MEEANRYFLVAYVGSATEIFISEDKYKEFLNNYNQSNRDDNNPRVKGNLQTLHASRNANYVVKYNIYKKVTKKTSLKTIDSCTTKKYETERELKSDFKTNIEDCKGKVYVGYMYKGEVRTLPVFYKSDALYADYESLTNFMIDNSLNESFLAKIWSDPKLNSPEYRNNIEVYLENLQESYGKYLMDFYHDESIVKESMRAFMRAWCTKDGVINQRRVREIGQIVKKNLSKENEKSSTKARKLLPYKDENEIKLF